MGRHPSSWCKEVSVISLIEIHPCMTWHPSIGRWENTCQSACFAIHRLSMTWTFDLSRLYRWEFCLSVCRPSVRLSVKRVHCDKTEERSVQNFIQYKRSFNVVFWEEEQVVGATLSTWNFASTGPRWSEIADFEPIFAHSTRAVSDNEKSSIEH